MNRKLLAGLALASLVATPALAAPSLGDTVTCATFDFTCSPGTATVSAGTEFTLNGNLAVDFSANALTLTNISGVQQAFTNGTVVFNDTSSPFTVVNYAGSSGVANFDQSNLSLRPNGLRIQFSDTTTVFAPNGSVSIAFAPLAAAVPEAASWATMILGIGAVGLTMRRRRATARVSYAA